MSPGIGGGGGREEEEGRTHCTCKGATHPGRRGVMLTLTLTPNPRPQAVSALGTA